MESIDLIESFSDFKEAKGIDRVTLMSILEDTFRSLLRKKHETDENFDIIVNPDKGDLEIWHNRLVVENGKVENPIAEIEYSEAIKIEPDFEVGEDVAEEHALDARGDVRVDAVRPQVEAA